MSPLRIKLADLTDMHRHWAALMADPPQGDGRLTQVQGFGSNPGGLYMHSYVAPSLAPGAPLVVVLHGCTQTADSYDAGTGWSRLAERHGFALLFPQQRRANNANTCFNWFEPHAIARESGEAASIQQMIRHMVTQHDLNPSRVYVTGLSAGGAMTAALLAAYPETFAGGAIIAGVPFGAAIGGSQALRAMKQCISHPAGVWGDLVRAAGPAGFNAPRPPVAIWHGNADDTVTPSNALESAKQWVDVHGMRAIDGIEDQVDGVPHRTWRGRDGAVKVELFAVPGLAHGTPITPAAAGDRGVGRAMPFVIEAPIAATWHTARRWGLLDRAASDDLRGGQPGQSGGSKPGTLLARSLRALRAFAPRP